MYFFILLAYAVGAIGKSPPEVSKTVKVAVIDTGVALDDHNIKYCESGHKDFSRSQLLHDSLKHGSKVSNVIQFYAKKANYCQIIVKYLSKDTYSSQNIPNFLQALEYVSKMDVDFINISAGGISVSEKERQLITQLLDRGVIVVAAAGNNQTDLSKNCNFFPACYDDRIIIVGSLDGKIRDYLSNYGKPVDVWAAPQDCPISKHEHGTSISAAIVTGKLIRDYSKLKKFFPLKSK